MELNRASAIILAILAAMLVVIAGKACSSDITNANRKNKNSTPPEQTIATVSPQNTISNKEQNNPEATDEEAQPDYIEVTNMIGEVVGTIPVTEPDKEKETDGEEETVETTTKSILEAYDELHTTSPRAETTTKNIEAATNIVIELR